MSVVNTIYQSAGMHPTTDLPEVLQDIFSTGESSTATPPDSSDTALMAFRIIVCILGVIGNAMVIFVIIVLREYKKAVTHWYVLQLAIADSLFLLTLPFKVVEDSYGQWTLSGGACKAKEAILFLNYYSSVLFLTVMSIDRYIAVCHSFSGRLQKFRSKSSAYLITGLLWITSLCLCGPVIKYSDKSGIDPFCKCQYEFPKDAMTPEENCQNEGFSDGDALEICLSRQTSGSRCATLGGGFGLLNESSGFYEYDNIVYDYGSGSGSSGQGLGDSTSGKIYNMGCSYARTSDGWTAYILFNFIVMFVLPFMVMSVCYLLIAFRLRQTQRRRSSVTNEGTSNSSAAGGKSERKRSKSAASAKAERNRIRVTCVCFVLVALFLICWLPFHSVHLAKMKGVVGTTEYCGKLSAAASLIAYLNSALNPYIYNFVGTKFLTRLRSAAGSVRTSVKNRSSSLSSGVGTVKYKPKKQSLGGSSSNSATVFTKIYKGKSDVETSHTPSNHDDDDRREDSATQSRGTT